MRPAAVAICENGTGKSGSITSGMKLNIFSSALDEKKLLIQTRSQSTAKINNAQLASSQRDSIRAFFHSAELNMRS